MLRHKHIHRRLVGNARNPLRKDPTRTVMVRRQMQAEVKRRFAKLKKAIWDFIVTKDALGLDQQTTQLKINVGKREYQFHTDANKLKAFNAWLEQQIEADVFSLAGDGADITKPWTFKYIESAYKRGMLNAWTSAKQGQLFDQEGFKDQSQEQFLRSSFGAPETISKVELLATRSFEGMKGLTSTMKSQMNRTLAQAIADGQGAVATGRQLVKDVDGLSKGRGLMIARTELIHAHSEGQLDAFEALGIEDVGLEAEWSTAGDDRVCPQCSAMEGRKFKIKNARGMIPLHPNCRCAWIPAV